MSELASAEYWRTVRDATHILSRALPTAGTFSSSANVLPREEPELVGMATAMMLNDH